MIRCVTHLDLNLLAIRHFGIFLIVQFILQSDTYPWMLSFTRWSNSFYNVFQVWVLRWIHWKRLWQSLICKDGVLAWLTFFITFLIEAFDKTAFRLGWFRMLDTETGWLGTVIAVTFVTKVLSFDHMSRGGYISACMLNYFNLILRFIDFTSLLLWKNRRSFIFLQSCSFVFVLFQTPSFLNPLLNVLVFGHRMLKSLEFILLHDLSWSTFLTSTASIRVLTRILIFVYGLSRDWFVKFTSKL